MNFEQLNKNIIKYIGAIFTLVSIYYIFNILISDKKIIIDSFFKAQALLPLLLGIILYLITQLNAVITWYLQLNKFYKHIAFIKYYEIIGISQIGKYLPGNIGHIIGRSLMAIQSSFGLKEISYSLLFETILLIYSGLIISFGFIFIQDLEIINDNKIYFYVLFISITVFLITYYYKFSQKLKYNITFITLIKIIIFNCLSFIILGLILYIFQHILLKGNISLFLLISTISIAFIAGFIMPGSPAGIGIREYVFIELLAANTSKTDALILILGLRIINIVGDIIMYIISLYLKNRGNKSYG